MGATGTPTETPSGKTVLLAGGGLGIRQGPRSARRRRAAGNRVIYFAGYRDAKGLFKAEEVEEASDVVVWAVDSAPGAKRFLLRRGRKTAAASQQPIDAMEAYAKGELGPPTIWLDEVEPLPMAIGSDRMHTAAEKEARHRRLKPYLKVGHTVIGSIN